MFDDKNYTVVSVNYSVICGQEIEFIHPLLDRNTIIYPRSVDNAEQ
jgi:hypothetical protein